MLSIARNILLFFVGVLLAVLFVYQGGVQAFSSLFDSPNDSVAQTPTDMASSRGRLNDDPAAVLVESIGRGPSRPNLQLLVQALRHPTFESIQLLRSESLLELPDYRNEVLPVLKREALSAMLNRFSDSDWSDWPNSFISYDGQYSAARTYVEDLKGINPDLGMFLETSAFLLWGLATQTEGGKVFDVGEQMTQMLDNAETLLAARKVKALPARYIFQPEVSTDPVFRTVLEQQRGHFVSRYLKRSPQNMKAALRLLGSLEPRLIGKDAYRTISKYLVYIATGASPRLREAFLYADMESGTLVALAEHDRSVRKTLSLLYVMAAVDSIEAADMLQARKFLHESVAIEPGQRIQRIVAQALKDSPTEAVSQSKPRLSVVENRQPLNEKAATPQRELRDEASVDWILLGGLIVFFCAVPLVVIYVLNRYRLKDLRYIEDRLDSDDHPLEHLPSDEEEEEPEQLPKRKLKVVG